MVLAYVALLAARQASLPVPYPGSVFVVAALLAAYFGGAIAGVMASVTTLVLLSFGTPQLRGWLPVGPGAIAVLGTTQLTAVALLWLLQERLKRSIGRAVLFETKAREAQALFSAEQTLRLVVDNIPQRVFWKDSEGRYLGCNAAFARDAGVESPHEIVGLTDCEMPWKDDAAQYRADDASVMSGRGAMVGYEEPQHRPDGSIMWLRTSKVPMLDDAGSVIGVLGTYEDTTEQRRREEQLRIASNAQENALESVVTLDLQQRILSVNRAFCAMTGYSREEVIGRDQSFLRSDRHGSEFYAHVWESARRTGRWQGELWRRQKSGAVHLVQASISAVHDDAGLTTHYVMVFNDISRARQDAERAAWLAYHDSLTGLSNRLAFVEASERAIGRAERNNTCVAVLYVDLDGFKPVNDSLGHTAGDEVLRQVAARLTGSVRRTDRVARLGGDEFALLIEGVEDSIECEVLADTLQSRLSEPYVVNSHEVFLSASIGISLAKPGENDPTSLLKNADMAMYEAKRAGRGRHSFYSHNLDARARRTLSLMSRLHRAEDLGELSLVYQPKVSLRDGTIIAFEALLRWNSHELGPVSPAEFIPVAESTGLIDSIGDWVILEACRRAVQWRSHAPDTVVCVNVSARQLRHSRFTERLEEILRETGLAPGALELEITESVVISEPERAIACLRRIRDTGVGLVLDDFGTGYSSLSYLKRLPVNCLKIDRSFIKDLPDDPSDASLVRAILGLARSLEIGVVGEGVETRSQLDFLRDAGCDAAQGYFFAPPLVAARAEGLLAAGSRAFALSDEGDGGS